ncbi:hypothetical protein K492DRAFT_211934 [Lichtheimia hyalospora FSU 10163]|nr:hypothetical protein K492DRAFT_211934 [Lichtheimia hyalospora FSU 10163]
MTTNNTLPVDILRRALPYMSLKSRLQLADTCRYWREFLLNEWEDMWDTIDIVTRDSKDNINSTDLKRVLLHAPRDKIRHLSFQMSDYHTHDVLNDIGSAIVKHGCDHIETIDIVYERVYNAHKDRTEAYFGEIIGMNKETLKRLRLQGNLSSSHAKSWLCTMFTMCSEVRELCYMAKHISLPPFHTETDLMIQLPPALPLRRLALSTIELTSALHGIASHCPYLEELVFDGSYSSTILGGSDALTKDILEQVDQHCPNIKHITINSGYIDQTHDPFEYGGISRDGAGLQVLKCTMTPSAGYNGTLQMLVNKHYTTLEKFILHVGKPDRITNIKPVPPLIFTGPCQHLRSLTIHDSPSQMMQLYTSHQLCNLLQACPCIDTLSLKSHALYTTQVYATLASMHLATPFSTLRHLHLECPTSISVREKDEYQHVSQSIIYLFETKGAAHLNTIELHLGGLVNDTILETIGNTCTSLSRLAIGRSNALTVAGIIAWVQHTQQTQLTHVSLPLYDDQSVMSSSESLLLVTMALSLLPQLIQLNLSHPTVTYKEAKEHLLRFCILSRSQWRPQVTYSGFNPTTGPFTAQYRLQEKIDKSSDKNGWILYACHEWWNKNPRPMTIRAHYDHQKHCVHMGHHY